MAPKPLTTLTISTNDNGGHIVVKNNDQNDSIGSIITLKNSSTSKPMQASTKMIQRRPLSSFNDYYEIGEEIGSGKFAIVKRCVRIDTREELAAKFIRKSRFGRMGQKIEDIELEIDILSNLNHVNVIKLFDIFEDIHQVVLVFELMKGGELQDYINEQEFLNESEAIYLLRQILSAVVYLHDEKSIIHLDLKPENILLDNIGTINNNNQLKIIDFGISRFYDAKSNIKGIYGTPEFIAPEILNYEPIGFGTDLWAIGCIAYNMLFGISPFYEEEKQDTYTRITRLDYDIDYDSTQNISISDDAKDFIKRLLVKDIRKRMTAKQCLEHRWLNNESIIISTKQLSLTNGDNNDNINNQNQKIVNEIARRRWKTSIYMIILYNRHIKRRLKSLLAMKQQHNRDRRLLSHRHYIRNSNPNNENHQNQKKLKSKHGNSGGSAAISSTFSSSSSSATPSTISSSSITSLTSTLSFINHNTSKQFNDNHQQNRHKNLNSTLLQKSLIDGAVNGIFIDNDENFILAALFGAIEEGNIHSLQELFQASNIDPNQCNKHGESLLHYCAGLGQLEIFKFLCKIGADINIVDDQGDTVVHWAARQNHANIIRYVYEQTASIEMLNKNNETPLHVAARYGHVETVEQLCKCGANINAIDEHGETAILIAVWHGFPKIVHILGEIGADTNIMNKEGESALHVASARGHYECVRCLLDAGANTNLRNKNSYTPLHLALKRQHQMIAMLLLKAGANYELADDNGERAIHYAARYNLISIGQWLCQMNRCDVNVPNKHGLYPLHIAAKSGHIEIVRTLCLAGSIIDQKDKDSIIPQICAIAQSHNDIADLLIRLRNEQQKKEFITQLLPLTAASSAASTPTSPSLPSLSLSSSSSSITHQALLPRIKLKIFGHSGVGKSTLIESLKCGYFSSWFRRSKGLNYNNINVNHNNNNSSKMSSIKSANTNYNQISTISGSITKNNRDNPNIVPFSLQNKSKLNGGMLKMMIDTNNSNNLNGDHNYNHQTLSITKGIDCQQLYISGVGDLSIWEFSGHPCYQQIYDHFIGEQHCSHCLHAIVFRLCDSIEKQIDNIFYWLYFIQSRLPIIEPLLFGGKSQQFARIILIATHADLAQQKYSQQEIEKNLEYIHSKVMEKFKNIFQIYDNIFMMDACVAGSTGMKQLKQYLCSAKLSIVQELPPTTGFLDSVLTFLNLYRKVSPNFPVLSYNQFKDMIRSQINPLSSDDHFKELVQQLEIMGEILFLKSTNVTNFDLLILNPKWLNCDIVGKLLLLKDDPNYMFNLNNKTQIMGIYSIDEFQELFDNVDALDLLQLLELLSLCIPSDRNGDIEYEFPCFILGGTDFDDILDRYQYHDNYVYHGFIYHLSQQLSSQTFGLILTSIFPRIQTTLRMELQKHSTFSLYEFNNCFKFSHLTIEDDNHNDFMFIISLNTVQQSIELRFCGPYDKRCECFFYMQEIMQTIEQTISKCIPGLHISKTYMSPLHLKDQRENISTYSTRSLMKTMLSQSSTTNSNANNHNRFKSTHSLLKKKIKSDNGELEERIGDILCFGICDLTEINVHNLATNENDENLNDFMQHNNNGEQLQQPTTLINELHSSNLSIITKQQLCSLLDPPESFGRDWCMFGILLGLIDKLPKLDPGISTNVHAANAQTNAININTNKTILSPTARVLEECVRNTNCTIKMLVDKLYELNRFDCIDCIYETAPLMRKFPLQSLPEEGIIYNDESSHTSLGVSTLSHTSSSNLSR